MSRLPRPHIPTSVRLQVAKRQVEERGILITDESLKQKEQLRALLAVLFGDKKAELHHRPSLVNRRRKRNGKYDPDANDPNYLIYLPEDDHDVETRIRGQHGAYSDLALARKNKRIAKNRDPNRRKIKIHSANRWPAKGSRKIQNRKKP